MRNPWIAILVAAANGKGLHLSADEVDQLAGDGAIVACAQNDIDRAGDHPPAVWGKVNPHKYPVKSA